MKKLLSAFFLVCCFVLRSYSQADTAFVGRMINNLKNYSSGHVREKAYLQFDKPYYAAGDTLYFKAYVTIGENHHLSNLSGVLHVDLIDPANKINHFIRLQLVNGVAWGDFALTDTLAPGNYNVRAYTQYMQKDDYFNQQFVVGSAKRYVISESVAAPKNPANVDVQFFPEGGNLVSDIRSRVAFKAIGTDGLGADVKGTVIDNFNNTVASFDSGFVGMGSFTLLPETGRAYKVRYKLKDSVLHVINLPAVQSKGIILTASTADANSLKLAVLANPAYYKENHGKFVLVSVYAGGKFSYVRSKLDSYELDLQIPISTLQSGVARATLFNDKGEPLSERLVFIKNPETDIAPAINADKVVYDQRDKVIIDLLNKNNGLDKSGHYSISVVNENKLPGATYANSIYAYQLLTSELKGYIEKPDRYFEPGNDRSLAELNALMLTQGYRKFSWQQLNDGIPANETKIPERSIAISGTLKTLNDKKPIVNGTVNLISPGGGPVLTTQTDSSGRFRFAGLIANDSTSLMLSAITAKGKNNTLIKLDRPDAEQVVSALNMSGSTEMPDMQTYLQNKQLQDNANLAFTPKGKLLKEVKVQSYRSSNYGGAGHADQVIDLSKENLGGTLQDVLAGRLHGVTLAGGAAYLTTYHTAAMLIVIDGIQFEGHSTDTAGNVPTDVLNQINPRDVATVEVLKYANTSIYGFNGGNGVLVITTKQGENSNNEGGNSTGILSFKPNGFYLAREFYSPKYLPGFSSAKPDLRSTIYWQPELRTDESGKASFSYYNADGAGNYRITVEGIDNNGNLAHTIYRYAVK